jgi:hypothetical protein
VSRAVLDIRLTPVLLVPSSIRIQVQSRLITIPLLHYPQFDISCGTGGCFSAILITLVGVGGGLLLDSYRERINRGLSEAEGKNVWEDDHTVDMKSRRTNLIIH